MTSNDKFRASTFALVLCMSLLMHLAVPSYGVTIVGQVTILPTFCGRTLDSFHSFVNGTDQNDRLLLGTASDDLILGNGGDDRLIGFHGDDCLIGGSGNDKIYGQSGDDTLLGGDGDDTLFAGPGDDFMTAGSGFDVCFPAQGDDIISECEITRR